MSNIIEVVGKFISFISKPIGNAFSKGIETVVDKTIEYKIDKYLTSTSQEKRESVGPTQLVVRNNIVEDNRLPLSQSVDISPVEKGTVTVMIQNNSEYSDIENSISQELGCIGNIGYTSAEYSEIWNKCNYPTILICLQGGGMLRCEVITKYIIPGVNDIAKLTLNYSKPSLANEKHFREEVSDSIITAVSLLKNTEKFCCQEIRTHTERLQLEAELLYKQGFRDISFKELPENGGYICELPVSKKDFVFFLPYEYPLKAPEIWVYEGCNSYMIPFANDCWKKDYTISQIITVIERGYYDECNQSI